MICLTNKKNWILQHHEYDAGFKRELIREIIGRIIIRRETRERKKAIER
jgi:hypothetical protein